MRTDDRRAVRADVTSRRARLAVAGLFLVNGYTFANIVPWMPVIKDRLDLSNTALGLAIAASPAGALLLGMLAGPLIARVGSGRVAAAAGVLSGLLLPAAGLAPSWAAFAAVMFGLGTLDAWMDSAMNAHGLRVQRRYGRSIINGFHALWSIGAVAGGLTASAASGLGVPILAHLSAVGVLLVLASVATVFFLLPGPEHAERPDEARAAGDADGADTPSTADPGSTGTPARGGPLAALRRIGPAALTLLGLGVLLVFAGGMEDSASSWGAVYMSESLHASAFAVGLPFVACQTMMTIGRLLGDRLTDRFGARAVGRAGALLAGVSLAVALAVAHPVAAVVGFGLLGLGVSTLFPAGLHAAGNLPGVRSGDGVTIAAWLARVGFLALPPLIGAIADVAGLGLALGVIPVIAVGAVLLSGILEPRRSARAADAD
ncbi:fucose permease [Allonocardiopsis opalescens]|uniref:Fucose permease n=1 Tax=Allonocardiopsis opalescens TaxID=1144618 RepID=A0A2T0QAJ2_9ACTN|nr:MFS transporter [Allonocardiopsis opalescens]PRY00830.1 fucose permease [Allonocardiopsis opalescens]